MPKPHPNKPNIAPEPGPRVPIMPGGPTIPRRERPDGFPGRFPANPPKRRDPSPKPRKRDTTA